MSLFSFLPINCKFVTELLKWRQQKSRSFQPTWLSKFTIPRLKNSSSLRIAESFFPKKPPHVAVFNTFQSSLRTCRQLGVTSGWSGFTVTVTQCSADCVDVWSGFSVRIACCWSARSGRWQTLSSHMFVAGYHLSEPLTKLLAAQYIEEEIRWVVEGIKGANNQVENFFRSALHEIPTWI